MADHPHPHAHHGHHHDHGSHRGHDRRGGSSHALNSAAVLTVLFALVEAGAGWWTGSLALVSDAGHMVTDGAALGFAALAAWIARRPPSARHSYGLGRAEIVAALVNAAAMLLIVAFLAYEAFIRLGRPAQVKGEAAAVVAFVGLLVNLAAMRWLAPHSHDMNARAARLHLIGDALGSVAALVSSVVIWLAGWTPIDALASLAICGLIALSSLRLLRESLHALMEGVPGGLSMETIGSEMASVEGVRSVHDLHVWMLSGSRTALSAHVVVQSIAHWEKTRRALQERLHERFAIDHVTLQPESGTQPLVRR